MTTRRARDAGIIVGTGTPGPHNAITDVTGIRVGHTTLTRGEGPLRPGEGPVRTGVTVLLPHDGDVFTQPLHAGHHWLNGNGELTGTAWIRENGLLMSPVALTNTGSVGTVRDTLTAIEAATHGPHHRIWTLPVVGETWDGVLNDINGQHVHHEHVHHAYDTATTAPPAEGNVGGGTGMTCHGFKGGTGTASRVTDQGYTVGVLLQANHGVRDRLTVLGAPIGPDLAHIPTPQPPEPTYKPGSGSIIVIVATDAPLLPHQCTRLAQRATLGIARTGGAGEDSSGDGVLAFSTANRDALRTTAPTRTLTTLNDTHIDPLFYAAIEATEEAILNALLAADTMTGRDDITAHGLDAATLVDALAVYARGPGFRTAT
ncbi:P1 family peptidase [Umezawaea sp. NPDC059074]|uniref:DmpA family aminopeptidase n=1 Tax=Umezawaea sp. NPDC059074 TaxID=3346716 RepID=UPI0036A2EBFD